MFSWGRTHCDGFGVCFEDDQEFDSWLQLKQKQHDREKELESWHLEPSSVLGAAMKMPSEAGQTKLFKEGRNVAIQQEIEQIKRHLNEQRAVAISRGNDPRNRVTIAGRERITRG
jgi:hypothetical protein